MINKHTYICTKGIHALYVRENNETTLSIFKPTISCNQLAYFYSFSKGLQKHLCFRHQCFQPSDDCFLTYKQRMQLHESCVLVNVIPICSKAPIQSSSCLVLTTFRGPDSTTEASTSYAKFIYLHYT